MTVDGRRLGYSRYRVVGRAYPAAVPAAAAGGGASCSVAGLLLHDVTAREQAVLDLFEEVDRDPPEYTKQRVVRAISSPLLAPPAVAPAAPLPRVACCAVQPH